MRPVFLPIRNPRTRFSACLREVVSCHQTGAEPPGCQQKFPLSWAADRPAGGDSASWPKKAWEAACSFTVWVRRGGEHLVLTPQLLVHRKQALSLTRYPSTLPRETFKNKTFCCAKSFWKKYLSFGEVWEDPTVNFYCRQVRHETLHSTGIKHKM